MGYFVRDWLVSMESDVEELLKKALSLPKEARAALAGTLLDSLDEPVDEGVEAEWALEISRRIEEVKSGAVATVPWAEARRQILADPDEPVSG